MTDVLDALVFGELNFYQLPPNSKNHAINQIRLKDHQFGANWREAPLKEITDSLESLGFVDAQVYCTDTFMAYGDHADFTAEFDSEKVTAQAITNATDFFHAETGEFFAKMPKCKVTATIKNGKVEKLEVHPLGEKLAHASKQALDAQMGWGEYAKAEASRAELAKLERIENELTFEYTKVYNQAKNALDEMVKAFNSQIFSKMDSEHDWHFSDENIIDYIEMCDIRFDESGNPSNQ